MKLETIKRSQTSLFGYTDKLVEKVNLTKRDELYDKYSDKLNKTKKDQLLAKYSSMDRQSFYHRILTSFHNQKALHEVLEILNLARKEGRLNNNNIPCMVENYFFEMNIVIHELGRVISPGGRVYMVNDNVQYMGEEVPVDLILSDFAQDAGFQVDCIWVLPKGKGNSSQQMGHYGRTEIRKCIYLWSK